MSTLVDALWGEDLPANPVNALQVRISKLRRALERLGAAQLLVDPTVPATCWTSGRERVDALRFADLVATARAVAGTDAAAGAEAYREALALWRGSPLGGVRGKRVGRCGGEPG